MTLIPTRIVPSVAPSDLSTARVRRELHGLVDAGAELRIAGTARSNPAAFLAAQPPSFRLELFDTRFYLTPVRQNPDLQFCVAYVAQPRGRSGRMQIHPRIFYKDGSLVWRCASHIAVDDNGIWIGKGDITETRVDGEWMIFSVEATTDLPLEMQTALEALGRRIGNRRADDKVLLQVLRHAPASRIQPYRDFVEPRRRAQTDRRNLVHGGRRIARFRRAKDPGSLVFTPGYEPDFRRGVVEHAHSTSGLYGGEVQRFRVLSRNRRIQYLFFAGPTNAWIVPPQALTTELSSYGVRTVDVAIDENLCVPAYEYHFIDDTVDPPTLYSQIPEGFVGAVNPNDPSRSDASPWIEQLPVIREFRRRLLGARSQR
ncbi:MAG: hypothetical protein AB7O21_06600 [Gammaproteobacteria bacterium]